MPDTRPVTDTQATPNTGQLALYWLAVGLPLAWGIWQTLLKALALFR
jgi:hypothetical protein